MIEDVPARSTVRAALHDASQAQFEFDDARAWLADACAGPMDPVAAEVWVFEESLRHVVLVRHRWRGWVCPGGKVEVGETPRAGAARELLEETGLFVDLLPRPAAVFVRSYRSDWSPSLGIAYAAVVSDGSPLSGESNQLPAWVPLARAWEGAFPEDRLRICQYAHSLL